MHLDDFSAHDTDDSRRQNMSHPVAAMCTIIKDYCTTTTNNQLPPIVRLPQCPLRAVFVADGTIFYDAHGNVRGEHNYFDELVCLRGARVREEVMRTIHNTHTITGDDVADYDDDEYAEVNSMPVDNPCLSVDDLRAMFASHDSDEYDDTEEAAIYGAMICAGTQVNVSEDERSEDDAPNVDFTVHTRKCVVVSRCHYRRQIYLC